MEGQRKWMGWGKIREGESYMTGLRKRKQCLLFRGGSVMLNKRVSEKRGKYDEATIVRAGGTSRRHLKSWEIAADSARGGMGETRENLGLKTS